MKLPPIEFAERQMRARPLFCFALAFLTGVIISHTRHIDLPFLLFLGAAFVLSAILLRKYRKNVFPLILAAAVCMGSVRMEMVDLPVIAAHSRYSVSMSGRVSSDPYIKSETGRLIFQYEIDSVDGIPEETTVRMYLRGDAEPLQSIAYGQTLSITGHIWAPDPVTNPHEFDFGAYLSENGMNAYATAKIEDVQIIASDRDFKSALIDLRAHISARIEYLFPDNAPIIQALVLADRSHLSDDIRDSFQKTGITHLICISGMHVSVLAMAVLFFLKRILSRKYAIGITIFFLLLYGVLIGFTASYVRALIMFMIFSCAPIAGYSSDGITRLSVALLLTLLISPEQIGDAGFVLSYSATAGIILLYPPLLHLIGLDGPTHRKPLSSAFAQFVRRILFYLPKLLCATLSAQLATLPAVIAFFGIQSIISVPVNLFCVPLCMMAYPVALAAVILSCIWMPLGMMIAGISDFMLSALTKIALHSALFPITGIRIGKYPALLILLHGCIIVAASNFSRIQLRIRSFIPLALVIVASLASLNTYVQGLGYTITFLDADQADCAVIQTEGHTFLVDTGNTYTPAGDFLDAHCLSLDGIFLSHPDQDHAGGLIDVLETMKPDRIYIPSGWYGIEDISKSVQDGMKMACDMGVDIIEVSTGSIIPLSENTVVRVYAPLNGINITDSNDLSCVFSVTHKDHSTLFTGDIPVRSEPAQLPDADVLKVAHHGSNESTSQSFIDQTSPEIAIISVGENNFGHPSEEVLARLRNSGVQILRTDESGAIILKISKDGTVTLDTFLPTGGIK